MGFPGGTSDEELTRQCRRHKRCGFSPWVRKIPWRRAWQPTPVLLPGDSHGQGSLAGCSPRGHTGSDATEVTKQWQQQCVALVAMQHVEHSWTGDRTRVCCIGRQILNHCATREVLEVFFVLSLYVYFSLPSQVYTALLGSWLLVEAWTVQAVWLVTVGRPASSTGPSLSPCEDGAKRIHSRPTLAPRKSAEMNGN